MEMDLDNPGTESSGSLDTNQAAQVFASMLDPVEPEKEQKAEAPAPAEPAAEVEAVEAEAAEDDPTVTIKVDGKDVEVKLSELKNGYQRQADYTRKTMEVSETRKAAEAEIQRAQQERQAYAANLQRMQAQLEGALQEQQKTVNWTELLNSDPVEYLKQQHLAQTRQAALQQNYAEQQQIRAQFEAESQARYHSYLQQQHEELVAKLPEWKDAEKAKAEKIALRDYLKEQGFADRELDQISDAKAVILAHKARAYDQMMAKAQAAAKKVSTLPTKVERPGIGENPGLDRRSAAFQRLSKSGKAEDAAAVFAGLL